MKGFYKVIHRIFALPFRRIFNIHVHNRENEPDNDGRPYLICANHMSAGDPVWICAALKKRQPFFMAKAELFGIPLLRGLISSLGAYPVSRGKVDVKCLRKTVDLLKNNNCVAMFPQGTRQSAVDPRTTSVKNGVALISVKTSVDVIPVFIKVKDNVVRLFGRKDIIIGERISAEKISEMSKNGYSYDEISKYLFGKVCELGYGERESVDNE